jgi:Spy/CpxP family protein refolding chaperone
MRSLRCMALGIGLVLAFGSQLTAADGDQKGRDRKGKGGFERFGAARALVAPEVLDKLKLSDEQKDKVTKLDKEFQEKDKAAFGSLRDTVRKAAEDKDREAMKKAFEQLRDNRDKATKLREEYEGKVAALLTADQKKTFDDAKSERRQSFGQAPGRRPETPSASGTSVLPQLERLNLSDEQKDKIAKLRKELESKIKDVLTDEQKKKLEDLQKDQPSRRRPQGNQ